jgi:hypothetical protein
MKYIERRQSETTGDAIWMKFECGAGSRWTSTTEDSTGDICGFSGCNCGTRVKFMGDTENRSEGWFGLRPGKPLYAAEARRIDAENVAAFEVQMQQASGRLFL